VENIGVKSYENPITVRVSKVSGVTVRARVRFRLITLVGQCHV